MREYQISVRSEEFQYLQYAVAPFLNNGFKIDYKFDKEEGIVTIYYIKGEKSTPLYDHGDISRFTSEERFGFSVVQSSLLSRLEVKRRGIIRR